MNLSEFTTLVRQARCIRRFDASHAVLEAELRALVECARLAPCSRNQQVIRFRLVHSAEERARIFPFTQWAGALTGWSGPTPGERAAAYILLLKPVGLAAGVDVGIAVQTIKLAAMTAGYGGCMLGALDRPAIHAALNLPLALEIEIGLALGRPGETVQLENTQPGASLNYWRTSDGVHHVPKLPLEELLLA